MQVTEAHTAAEEIDAATAQLAHATAREHEAKRFVSLDEAVHVIEQLWKFLNFVDDDERRSRVLAKRVIEKGRIRGQRPERLAIEKIEKERLGPGCANERGFAGLSWPEEQNAFARCLCFQVESAFE